MRNENEISDNWYSSEQEYVDSSDTEEFADSFELNDPISESVMDDEFYDDEYDEEQSGGSIVHTIVYMMIVLAFSIGIAILLWFAADDVLALTKADNEVTIVIGENDTLMDVAENLQSNGLINYKYLFVIYGKFSHAEQKFSAGTFELNQMFDYHALVNGLSANSETRKTVTLTFPEGYSLDQIINMLSENDVCTEEELKEVCANYEFDYEFLQGIPYGEYNRLEGYMFPDTYEFYVGDTPERVVNKFLSNFNNKVTEIMIGAIDSLNQDLRSRMEAEGSYSTEEIDAAMMDLSKIITLASLIEKEAGSDAERPTIASVIYNRLTSRVHELLQIDATVEYALGEYKPVLTDSDLAYDSPYNTYKYKGLPPGPIANPGLSSIMAAIYPESSDYYFYALNSSGTHEFFYTYIEQQEFISESALQDTETEAAPEETTEESTETEADSTETENGGVAVEPFYQQTITNEDGEEETINVQ